MKKPFLSLVVLICLFVVQFTPFTLKAQQSLTQIDGWNAYVHLPANYNGNSNRYPTIIFFPGIGEIGSNASAVIANGPGAYIAQGWNGNVTNDGNLTEFIVISLQPLSAYPKENIIDQYIQKIKSLYRVNTNKLYLTGLSHGGWCSSTYVTGDPSGGPYTYASQIAAVATVEGMKPSDNSPYPNLFDNYARAGGRYLGFEQIYDGRDTRTVVDRMNATRAGSAIYVSTSFGSGGHCCWNEFYGGQGSQPKKFMLDGKSQNIYEWLARQSLGAVNQMPAVEAGADKIITLPASSTTLDGSGTDSDGSVVSYLWTKISGPAAGTIANPAIAKPSLTGLVKGTYNYQLKVTDNGGATATDNVIVSVNSVQQIVPACNANAPVTHILSQTAPGEIYRPNGSAWKGGDTVKITGTNYTVIEFNNIGGDPCRPLVIMPASTLTTPVMRFLNNCRYIKFWGGKTKYGAKVNGTLAIGLSDHIEIDNVECYGGTVGVYCKQNVEYANPLTWSTNSRMTKFAFKNMWIHDVQGEGLYIGSTDPDGSTVRSTYSNKDTVIQPIRVDSVEISNCLVERTKWDGIQLSNARNGNKIFNNTVRNYGTVNMSSQQVGILMGGNTSGDIYNNKITQGTGNGIQVFGYGVINIYGNILDSCGINGKNNPNGTNGQHSIYASDYLNAVEVNPKQTINAYSNAINHPKTAGAIFVTNYNNYSNPSSVYNNTFCIPNAGANWQAEYLLLSVAGSSNVNNVLSCSAGSNIAPVANAGSNNSITLPTNSVTVSGTGTDADGTITGYAWLKISGPSGGSITNAGVASTAITGLLQGVYKYKLTVTDNKGATGMDTVEITVNGDALLPAVNPSNTVAGLDYRYYEGDWSVLPDFSSLTPVKTGTTTNFSLAPANNATQYGFSFTGFVNVPSDGQYTFYTSSDDGSNLLIDNVWVVANDGLHGEAEQSGVVGLKAGKHAITGLFFQQGGGSIFTVSYAGTGITKQAIPAAALYRIARTNLPPVVNAGGNQTISLPTSSATLNGSGSDPDGTIASFQWTKISGPSGSSFGNAAAASTTINGLIQGTYQFQLKATDNLGASTTATTQVIVNAAPSGTKTIRVNLYGGTKPFTDTKWNNWNISSGLTTAKFLYEDRTSSPVNAVLSSSMGIADNGSTYAAGSTVPPPAVLRYNSYSNSTRLLTLKGLDRTKQYRLEFYASRANTGNKTVFTIGSKKDSINTDNNVNDYAKFADIVPNSSGAIEVNISRIGTYNYLAGFSIIEQSTGTGSKSFGYTESASLKLNLVNSNSKGNVYPNPFSNSFNIALTDANPGVYTLTLLDVTGKRILSRKIDKPLGRMVTTVEASQLVPGTYLLEIIAGDGSRATHKVIRN